MSELNKDGLIPGQAVDFSTLMKLNNKHKSEAAKNESNTKQPKVRSARKSGLQTAQDSTGTKES